MDEGAKIIDVDVNGDFKTWIFTWKLAVEMQPLMTDKGPKQTEC